MISWIELILLHVDTNLEKLKITFLQFLGGLDKKMNVAFQVMEL